MSAEDELAIPEIPEAKPDDPEDVSWSLSTAEAMWARGDHLEGIKWVRKAAEAAADTDDDARALELAKAASDLTTLIARRSRASVGDGPGYAGGAPPAKAQSAPQNHPSARPGPQSAPPPPGTKSVPPITRSVAPAPIPLPSRASSAPRPPQGPQAPQAARGAPRPPTPSDAPRAPLAGVAGRNSAEPAAKSVRGRRRSRENLDAEAKQAAVLETAPQTAVDGKTAEHALVHDDLAATTVGTSIDVPSASTRARRRSRPDPDPTVVTRLTDLAHATRQKSVAEWDASPTQNLTGDEMESNMNAGDRATTAVPFVTARPSPSPMPPPRPPATTVHDPEIQTSQAVHVVVWRDATGVHIAPSGTVVSAITIDAVLVALEPSADLTAWLSQRER